MPRLFKSVALLSFSLIIGPAASAGEPASFFRSAVALGSATDSDCDDGVVYDDGTFESTVGPAEPGPASFVMLFDAGGYPASLDRVCICWDAAPDTEVTFDLRVWSSDGPNGSPGGLLHEVRGLQTAQIPSGPGAEQFFSYDLSGIVIDGPVYIGPSWFSDQSAVTMCVDDSISTQSQPSFFTAATPPEAPIWVDLIQFGLARALGIRALLTESESVCNEDSETMCLNENRFEVRADWRRRNGETGRGQAVELTDDTGYFWFFNEANVEMVIKVLDACNSNFNTFWVFAGGLTNVEVDITVTDTQTGDVRVYSNPQGTPFQPIQDTEAFATCP